ncbi:MAG: replication initiator protein A, partial [Lachnospiraceae bacterium]|nr:replication initiator protein A [Lachnospiraceae bacterium]
MSEGARLDYFYGTQSEQFQFLTVPLIFFSDPIYSDLDCDEIMLYSHMLRRINLSRRNGWIDALNRVYIRYSQKEARNDMRRGKDKVLEAYRALERHDLIERLDMGIGKADLIYVKNFAADRAKDTDEGKDITLNDILLPD